MNTFRTIRLTIGLISAAVLFTLASCQQFPYPDKINMSSSMDMSGMNSKMVMPTNSSVAQPKDATSIESLSGAVGDQPLKTFNFKAQIVHRAGLPDLWTYNGTVPGPEIRVNKGDHVRVNLTSDIADGVTIHWHGVKVPNREDGVAGLTQNAVKPGQSYTYDFVAGEAGTFWYHSHQMTSDELPKGLFGSFVVDDPEHQSRVDKDFTIVYHNSLKKDDGGFSLVMRIIAQRFGGFPRADTQVNGKDSEVFAAKPGDRVRLRIINALAGEMPGAPLRIAGLGADVRLVAIDGHDLHQPQVLGKRLLLIGMGQRFDLEFLMPTTGDDVTLRDADMPETVSVCPAGSADCGPEPASSQGVKWWPSLDLTNYGSPTSDRLLERTSFDAVYPLELGETPGKRQGRVELVHTINGKAFPDIPMIMVKEGQAIKLHLVNNTGEFHPMHLHGHVFSVLALNGKPVKGSPIHEDSVLLAPHTTADVAFVADNPGLWMFHCHVLIHAAFGMDMMVGYPNIVTPFSVGDGYGNIPE